MSAPMSPHLAARAAAWLEMYGSPLYVYDLGDVERRTRELMSVLPEGSRVLFSLKANPLPAMAEALCRLGCDAEVSSPGELAVAVAAGFAPERVLYSGPGKSADEVRGALGAGVTRFSAESWTDLERIDRAARAARLRARVLLRVNPDAPPVARLAMSGVSSQFGLDEAEWREGRARVAALGAVELMGLHIYQGTQLADIPALLSALRVALEVGESLSSAFELPFQVMDLGGGFPWPFATPGVGPELAPLREPLAQLAAERRRTASASLWFESGRRLCGSSGTLWSTVMDVKRSKGKQYVVLDSGIHHLGGMSGLGRVPLVGIGVARAGGEVEPGVLEEVNVVGPLCTPLDCFARNLKLPPLRVGDRVFIPNVGAYGATASLTGFLSRPPPLELAHRDGEVIAVHRLRWGHEPHTRLPIQGSLSSEETR
ncbi:type III PLP-dependent enzyme [Myxococcus sp. CA056]|uniref:type III PLP-dependent enzyme n=1 Tax=unclassified Myxococcus TaxID=2648731 RepID=UPI00157A9BCC|nr:MULTISPECIES: type III PLP-dependent enzyme [unclassified Myxococcus]NTX16820.1 type III PLP-dependent enzyme [Myxococcus sp. CA056]NTX41412.1 type III PLP-dependent enzyme [Myxococcus sp. CA033]NTX57508.1 type III PLP-dependent enzyme [Myxococcus sp. CA039A]